LHNGVMPSKLKSTLPFGDNQARQR
jgi:hypothetical protein